MNIDPIDIMMGVFLFALICLVFLMLFIGDFEFYIHVVDTLAERRLGE